MEITNDNCFLCIHNVQSLLCIFKRWNVDYILIQIKNNNKFSALKSGDINILYWTITSIIINPLVPSAHKSVPIGKILILKLEGITRKISYERREYESVDEKSLS